MAKEAQSHRVSKTPTASAGHNDMLQGAPGVIVRGTLLAASNTEATIKAGECSSLALAFSVPLWPTPVDCGRNRG